MRNKDEYILQVIKHLFTYDPSGISLNRITQKTRAVTYEERIDALERLIKANEVHCKKIKNGLYFEPVDKRPIDPPLNRSITSIAKQRLLAASCSANNQH